MNTQAVHATLNIPLPLPCTNVGEVSRGFRSSQLHQQTGSGLNAALAGADVSRTMPKPLRRAYFLLGNNFPDYSIYARCSQYFRSPHIYLLET
jgi:hypothetical protein